MRQARQIALFGMLALAASGVIGAQPRPPLRTLLIPYSGGNTWYGIGSSLAQAEVVQSAFTGTLMRTEDGGRTWTSLYIAPIGEYQYVDNAAVHPDRPQIVYAVRTRARGGFYRSEDGGRTWQNWNEGLPAVGELMDVAIVPGPGEEGRIRVGDVLYRLEVSEKRWSKLADLPSSTSYVAYDAARPQRGALVATRGTYYETTNGGASWAVRGQLSTSPGERFALQIAFDPRDANLIFVRSHSRTDGTNSCPTPSGGVYRSANGGQDFTFVYESGFCDTSREVFIDPVRSNVYLGSGAAFQPYCVSINRGENFNCITETGATALRLMAVHPRTGQIWRASMLQTSTTGAAVWENWAATFRPALYVPGPIATVTAEEGETSTVLPVRYADASDLTPNGTYRVTVLDQAPWLTPSRTSGEIQANGNVDLRVAAGQLAPGSYRTRIQVDTVGTVNTSFTVGVTFTVTPRTLTGVRYRFDRLMGNAAAGTAIQDNVPAVQQPTGSLRAVARDAQGNVYVMSDRRLRRIDPNGRIVTIAGDGTDGETADGTPALQAKFRFIEDLAVGRDGTIYLRESIGVRVYALKDGVVRLALTSNSSVVSRFASLRSMCASPSGGVYVTESTRIIRLESGREPEFVSGFANFAAAAGASMFNCAAESDSSWIFSDPLSHRVFRWSGTGLTVLAGTRVQGLGGDGGPATQAVLSQPRQVVVDTDGNVIFHDAGNRRLRIIRPDGRIYTLTGRQSATSQTTGLVAATQFLNPVGMASEPNGGLLFASFSALDRFTRLPFGTPVLQSGSAVNGASQVAALSPGSLITVYGADLALETRAANFSPLALVLGGAEILLNGQPIPIIFASPSQVNAQIPPGAAAGPAKIRARVDGKQSVEIDVQIATAAPGIFVYGANRAVAQNQDGAINGEASPEAVGNFAVLYVTGIGPTDNPVAAGGLSPVSPLARAVNAAELRVGDSVANVLFVGLTPGFIGLGQVNFEVPNLEPGDYPITLSIAGNVSNAPLFAVRSRPE